MGRIRQTRNDKFGTPERQPHLRIIFATIGPGKARLLERSRKRIPSPKPRGG